MTQPINEPTDTRGHMDDARMRDFVNAHDWTFATTYKDTAPHEYVVIKPDNKERKIFEAIVLYIRARGYDEKYEGRTYRYYDLDGKKYWTMGDPLEVTIILNRTDRK